MYHFGWRSYCTCTHHFTIPMKIKLHIKNNIFFHFKYNTAHMIGYTTIESFKDLMSLRQKESFQFGALHLDKMQNDVLYFTRKAPGFPSYLVTINRGQRSAYSFSHIAKSLTLVYHSENKVTEGDVFNTEAKPIGFTTEGEVYVFMY